MTLEGIMGGRSRRSSARHAAVGPRVSIATESISFTAEDIERRQALFKEAIERSNYLAAQGQDNMLRESSIKVLLDDNDSPLHVAMPEERRCSLFSCKKKKGKRRCTRRHFDLKLANEELIECCLTHMMDTYKINLNRIRGIELLNMIVDKANVNDVTSSMAVHITWACLSCIHHFLLRLKTATGPLEWARRRQVRRSVRAYERVLKFLLPDMYKVILNAIIAFFEESNLWQIEYLCTNLLRRLFYHTNQYGESLLEILTLAEYTAMTNMAGAREIINVIREIEIESKWCLLNENFVRKLLNMYYCSIVNQDYNYKPLRPVLDMCVRDMSDNMNADENRFMFDYFVKNATKREVAADVLLEYSIVVDHVGHRFRKCCTDPTLTFSFLPDFIALIGSQDVLYSLFGHRLLHQLLDREENRTKLKEPIIFFIETDFHLNVGVYNKDMKDLYKTYRESIQKTFIAAVLTHGRHKVMLEHTFLSIALLVIEVPCAYTAASAVCIAVALQEHAMNDGCDMKLCHGIHATVMGIMSLVAYVHRAEIFYDYVSSIMELRAKHAPHLNPPLKSTYKYAQHHVLWNSPGFFFEHFNCRYGLMKCFVTKRRNRKPVK